MIKTYAEGAKRRLKSLIASEHRGRWVIRVGDFGVCRFDDWLVRGREVTRD
ncbi:MAG: hypothetical protein AAF385_05790 [Pseudomonadota bacterium]